MMPETHTSQPNGAPPVPAQIVQQTESGSDTLRKVLDMARVWRENHPSPADPRQDVYAFGASVYQMLTGRGAQPGASMSEDVADPALRAVYRAVTRCLLPAADGRWQSLQKMVMDLKLAHAGSPRKADHPIVIKPQVDPATRARLAALEETLTQFEHRLSSLDRMIETMDTSLSARLTDQSAAIAQVRGGLAQTDELLEELVESFGSLQQGLSEA